MKVKRKVSQDKQQEDASNAQTKSLQYASKEQKGY